MKAGQGVVLAAVVLGIAACSSDGSSGGSGNAGAVHQVECFARATSSAGYAPFTLQVLGTSDCTAIAGAVRYTSVGELGSYTATPGKGSATGAKLCSGVVGNYPVNVYGKEGDTSICGSLGLSVVP